MTESELSTMTVPGEVGDLSLKELSEDIRALRDKARDHHRGPALRCVEIPLIDARTWSARPDGEDWLMWRARLAAERLRAIPIDLEPGERVVGKPLLREATAAELPRIDEAQRALGNVPPFPGGDAGHFHPDYRKLFRVGIGGILNEVSRRSESAGPEQKVFYDSCRVALEGMAAYVRRVGRACERMARRDPRSAPHWRGLADICRRIATGPPGTFHEAIQLMFLAQIALWFGEGHHLTSPGRMDQTLRPFYQADLAAGRISRQDALHLISCLFIQMNRVLWPGSAVAVMVGGRDREGRDVTNDLTYLCLAARMATRLVYPTVGLAWHEGTPAELMDFAMSMLASGVGDPAFFNDEVISAGLRDHGVSPADSYDYVNSTCVEVKVAGASNIWVTQPYFNLPQALLEAMRDASDGARRPAESFGELVGRVKRNLGAKIAEAAQRLDAVWQARAERGCFPLASCLVRDCLERGLDFDRGGARYNWVENSCVGLANLVDGLIAVKHLVYERHELTLNRFWEILEAGFEGEEALRQRIAHGLPKYGNDEEEPDGLAREVADFLMDATESRTVGPHRYVPGFFCWVMHERLGSQTGATPDGRPAGRPLADGAGAAQGRERRGPTASVLSTTAWSHRRALGGLVHNAKFSASIFRSSKERRAVRNVIETYLKRGGFEIQVNVTSADELRDAQEHPDRYAGLLVRVAGYSDYFVHLNRNMQDEIVGRTEFGA